MTAQQGQPVVFLILPPLTEATAQQEIVRLSFLRDAERHGWQVRTRRTKRFRVSGGREQGRHYDLMEPWDAHELYQVAHKNRVGVFLMGSARVLLDPTARLSKRNSVALDGFVRYKAFFGRLNTRDNPQPEMHSFKVWMSSPSCSGERDARCLPLHVFSPNRDWLNLHDTAVIQSFDGSHGPAALRTDHSGHTWVPAKALHGHDVLLVAGTELRAGFHWDVEASRTAARLTTSIEVWKFARTAYCNVYPNATVRNGQSAKGNSAKCVHRSERPQDQIANAVPANKTTPERKSRRKK
jgi:hypothetical protein